MDVVTIPYKVSMVVDDTATKYYLFRISRKVVKHEIRRYFPGGNDTVMLIVIHQVGLMFNDS